MSELSAAFEGLDDAFDTEFEEDTTYSNVLPDDDISTTAVAVREETPPAVVTEDDNAIRDTNYVSNEIKNLSESSTSVLNTLPF